MDDTTAVTVDEIPRCAFHEERSARYDGKTTQGPWASMCRDCFKLRGVGLGLGRGQELRLRMPMSGGMLSYHVHPYFEVDVAEILKLALGVYERTETEEFWLEWQSEHSDLGWVGLSVNHLGWVTVDHWDGEGALISTDQLDGWEDVRQFVEAVLL